MGESVKKERKLMYERRKKESIMAEEKKIEK
jgi:hypothetical protein